MEQTPVLHNITLEVLKFIFSSVGMDHFWSEKGFGPKMTVLYDSDDRYLQTSVETGR